MEFPRKRFERVGASQDELDSMEAEFDASSEAAQRSLVDRVAPLADSAVAALLDGYREREQAAAPAPAPSQPAASSSSSSSASSAPAKPSQSDSSQQS